MWRRDLTNLLFYLFIFLLLLSLLLLLFSPSENLFIGRKDEKIFSSSSAPKRKKDISLGEEVVERAEDHSFLLNLASSPLLLLSKHTNKHLHRRRGGKSIPSFFLFSFFFHLAIHLPPCLVQEKDCPVDRETRLFGIMGEAYPVLLKLP